MATWQQVISFEMEGRAARMQEVSPVLDQFLARAWGHDGIQYWGPTDSNDVHVTFDTKTDEIEDMQFRVDLREPDRGFVERMIELAKQRGWKFRAEEAGVFEPELAAVIAVLRGSRAASFVRDPHQFFRDLESRPLQSD